MSTIYESEHVLTVGELRDLIRVLPDDLPVAVEPDGGEAYAVIGGDHVTDTDGAYMSVTSRVADDPPATTEYRAFLQLVSVR